VPGNIKVATLTSTLEVVFKGAEAAKAAADTVARAEQLIEEAASSASAELRVQAREQDKLIDKLRELTSESKKSADGLTEADTTLKTLRESLRDVSEEAGRGGQMFSGYQDAIGVLEALRSTVSDLEGETGGAFLQATLLRNRIAEFESLPTGTDYSEWLKSVHEDTQRLLGDTDAMDRLAEGVQKVDDAAKVSEIDKTLVDIAKGSDEMAKKMSQGRREASLFDRVMSRLNATTLTGFVRLLRSGNVGNALLAQGLVNVRRSAQGAEKG
jgi:predicted  nucleic acid-binding Zn-ribbon protein